MLIAGVDEAGRGPLAGPVISAAVILDPKKKIRGLNDSKLLTPAQRESLFVKICSHALAWAVGRAEVEEIDCLNILQASLLSMQRALNALTIKPQRAIIDGIHPPKIAIPTDCIIDGDRLEPAISAASIIAKVTRDREMRELDRQFPGFGFAQHKGYGTEQHLKALRTLGPCVIHRRSFAPIKVLFEQGFSYKPEAGLIYHEAYLLNLAAAEKNKINNKTKVKVKNTENAKSKKANIEEVV